MVTHVHTHIYIDMCVIYSITVFITLTPYMIQTYKLTRIIIGTNLFFSGFILRSDCKNVATMPYILPMKCRKIIL